ncbi:3-oxoacid CoA-transferase subunit B [Cohnella kolymensis]|uniref:3-oxoacid CoA-transferase subunit B n=1 Tax=Cohnella kolymensis TaxID=1590652 RepID=UPI000A90D574|nr:3-oxoacid CoA-transferase subunit B [Cohnella kolymensis]
MSAQLNPDEIRKRIARRIALELESGMVVNLGVGIPTLIQDFLQPNHGVFLQSENGLLGMGPTPPDDEFDMDLISASKHPITLEPGASIFSSSDSFAMIRGGHIDVAVMGALQVSERGEIANWSIPGQDILGVGGAMDLVASAKTMMIAINHLTKDSKPKLVRNLSYPTSGIRFAQKVIDGGERIFIENSRMILREIAPDCTLEEISATTEAHFEVAEDLKTMPVTPHAMGSGIA